MRESEQERNAEREKIATMAATRKLVMPVIMLIMVLSVAAVGAARPLAGEERAGEAAAGESVARLLRQRLSGPGHSCKTWNPNGGCR